MKIITTKSKNKVLETLKNLIQENLEVILAANRSDLENCGEIDPALFERLKLDSSKILGMVRAVEDAIIAPDPVGKILSEYLHPNGLKIQNQSFPFGKILIIYESRPDVTIEASIIAFKSGNKVYLKGGKEAEKTNQVLVKLWHQALAKNLISLDYINFLNLNRTETQKFIVENPEKLDLIIPRGGEKLIDFVQKNSSIPAIISGRGNNFLYLDADSDFQMAKKIILNGKSRISVCNALDKVLINSELENLPGKISELVQFLESEKIEVILGFEEFKENPFSKEKKEILKREFLVPKIYLDLVENLDHAIEIINKYSGGHSSTIITNSEKNAQIFQEKVDCAAVYHNASTRFTDGGEFGFPAEIAISTQKLHFRGPIGLEQLVTNKWIIKGQGQIR